MTEINGSVLLDFKRFLMDSYGDSSFAQLTEEVADKAKEVFSSPILVGEWYPLEAWHDILSAFSSKYGK